MDKFILRLNLSKKLRGFTNESLAAILGVSHSTMRNYASGRTEVPTSVLIDISSVLNIRLEWLITGIGEMEKTETDALIAAEEQFAYNQKGTVKTVFQKLTTEAYSVLFDEILRMENRIATLERQITSKQ